MKRIVKQHWLKVVLFGLLTVFCIHAQMTFAATPPIPSIAWTVDSSQFNTVDFNAGGTYCPSGSCTYAWNFGVGGGGTGCTDTTSVSPKCTYTAATAGTHTVTLTVTDSTSTLFATKTATVTSITANQNPTASIEWKVDSSGTNMVDFSGAGSYCNGGCTYTWGFTDPNATSSSCSAIGGTLTGTVCTITGTAPTLTYTYSAAGTYTVTLQVTDSNDTLSNQVTTHVTTETFYKKPTAKNSSIIVCTQLDSTTSGSPCLNQPVGLTATLTDNSHNNPTAGTCMATVTWGDGTSTTQGCGGTSGTPFTHTYATGGKYEVMETAEDMTSTLSASAVPVVIYPWDPNTVPTSTPPCPNSIDGYYCGQTTLYQNTNILYYCHNGSYALAEICSGTCAATTLGSCSGGTLTTPLQNVTQATCTADGGTVWTQNNPNPDSCQ